MSKKVASFSFLQKPLPGYKKQSILKFFNQREFVCIPDPSPIASTHFYIEISISSNI